MAELADKKFYILRAISGKEYKVREQIETEMKLTELGLSVFSVMVPSEKVVTQRNGKKTTKERPSLPGYVIVEAILTGEVIHRLRSMQNVIGFLGAERGNKPEPISQRDVDNMLRHADRVAESEGQYDLEIFVGDVVKITQDAFAGCEAVVEEVVPEKRKLKVMVKMFGRKIPLDLDYAQVSKE